MPLKRPDKDANAEALIAGYVGQGFVRIPQHCRDRMVERQISYLDILSVLRQGRREPRKDEWKPERSGWRYAYRGRDSFGIRELRVAVALDVSGAVVVTVIDLDAGRD